MNVAKATGKLKEQIHIFSGKLSVGLPRVAGRFLEEAIFGIQARQSLHLSEWGRALHEKVPLIKTINRLSRQLNRANLWANITARVLRLARGKVGQQTLLVIDISDISKCYAKKMEYLGGVHDGSKGVVSDGYWTLHVVACEAGGSEVIPLYSRLYSALAPDFEGENIEIIKAVQTVCRGVGDEGTWVIDRGGDRGRLYEFFLNRNLGFIIRLKGDRHLVYRGRKVLAQKLSGRCNLPYREVLIREESQQEKRYDITFGFLPVQLPDMPMGLSLVVVTGFGSEPMMLLTNLPMRRSRAVLYQVVESYLSRWRIEETIRFVKQSYQLEDVRVLTYTRLQNMMALVLAVAYFTMAYLARRVKLKAISHLLLKVSRRIFGIPDFRYYALSDGIRELLKRHEKGPLRSLSRRMLQRQFSLFNP
jgi:hypothetical protein